MRKDDDGDVRLSIFFSGGKADPIVGRESRGSLTVCQLQVIWWKVALEKWIIFGKGKLKGFFHIYIFRVSRFCPANCCTFCKKTRNILFIEIVFAPQVDITWKSAAARKRKKWLSVEGLRERVSLIGARFTKVTLFFRFFFGVWSEWRFFLQ